MSLQTPCEGTFTATGGGLTFPAIGGKDFNASTWGTFVASFQLERSFNNGANWLPVTAGGAALYAFSAPCSEIANEPEQGVLYRWNCTAFTSGTVNYRISL